MKFFKNKLTSQTKILFFGFFVGFFLFSSPFIVSAKKTIADAEGILKSQVAPQTGVSTQDLSSHVGTILQASLRLIGLAFLILMVYGGLRWMSARGNEADIEAAKETITAAIIGLIVVVGAYAITNFVTQRLIEGQSGNTGSVGETNQDVINAPEGCCQFKINEIPTWTAFMMTQDACKASCQDALGPSCGSDDFTWSPDMNQAACEIQRQDALR